MRGSVPEEDETALIHPMRNTFSQLLFWTLKTLTSALAPGAGVSLIQKEKIRVCLRSSASHIGINLSFNAKAQRI